MDSGNDGVRVTVVRLSDHAVVTAPIDLTNKHPDGLGHFQKVSKLEYTNGAVLSPSMTGYTYVNPGAVPAQNHEFAKSGTGKHCTD